MTTHESDPMSADEQIRELAALFARGLLRWQRQRNLEPAIPTLAQIESVPKTIQKPLELLPKPWLSVHSG